MSSKWATLRHRAHQNQHGRCYYCGRAMWLSDPRSFARSYRLTLREAGQLQATAEHLVARCDGGQDTACNIVAACRCCNGRRHRRKAALSPERYRDLVQRRMAAGRWYARATDGGRRSR